MNENGSSQEAVPAGAPLTSQPSPPARILVVDDDEEIRHLNTSLLARSGYEVESVQDGAAAWDALELSNYDLVVTDNRMPKLTGVELLQKLRAARMDVPVIMATGIVPDGEFTQKPWLRPAITLVKPYTIAELLGAVKQVLRPMSGAQ